MAGSTAAITAEQRRAIHELVCLRLISVSDLGQAILRDNFATAERLGLEFGEDLWLMDDLGWLEDDDRAVVELTMPAEDLTEALKRLRLGAGQAAWLEPRSAFPPHWAFGWASC